MNRIVVIAASEGGLTPLRDIVSAIQTPCFASIFIVWHTGAQPSILPSLLRSGNNLLVAFGLDDEPIVPGCVYVAPPDRHMLVGTSHIHLNDGAKVHHSRPAADPLFTSAAQSHGALVLGIVLSGGDGDGAAGLLDVKLHGGRALVQDPEEAVAPSMPHAAIATAHPDCVLKVHEIAQVVRRFCSNPSST